MLFSGTALADTYNVILKDSGTPCATYEFDGTVTGTTQGTFTFTTLSIVSSGSCTNFPGVSSTGSYTATFDPTSPAPSRVKTIEGTGDLITMNADGSWDAAGYTESNASYFIYNSATVPLPATLPLLLVGGAGVLLGSRIRRRRKK
jgi:hypothetical protein